MRAGEGVIVLVADADRRIEPLGQRHRSGDGAADDHAGAVQDHRELGPDSSLAASAKRLSPPDGRSKATICGSSMSITWVQ
jgi:hypothetical protein